MSLLYILIKYLINRQTYKNNKEKNNNKNKWSKKKRFFCITSQYYINTQKLYGEGPAQRTVL